MARTKGSLRVALIIGGRNDALKDTAAIGGLLSNDRGAIESELGYKLDWALPPKLKSVVISFTKSGFDLYDSKDRSRQYDWISDKLREFDDLYREHVQVLNPTDFVHDVSETTEYG